MIPELPFLRPWVLLAFAGLPAYLWLRLRVRRQAAVPLAPLQFRRPESRRSRLAPFSPAVEAALVATALLGLATPYDSSRLELLEGEGIDVALVLDISLSMMAEDFPPNRLEASRRVARDFIERSGEHRVGIVVFAKDAFVHTPLTTDHASLLSLLDDVTVFAIDQAKSGGTAIGDALLVAGERLERSKVEGRSQALVLITDGESNLGVEPELAARYLAEQEVRFYAIGIGGTEPVEVIVEGRRLGGDRPYLAVLDDAELQAVAAAAGGRYFRAEDVGSLEAIFGELARLESAPLEKRTLEVRHPWTSRIALAVLLLFGLHLAVEGLWLRRPWR